MDGRGCEDYRCVEVETDVVSNTSGSARVKLVSAMATVRARWRNGYALGNLLQPFGAQIVLGWGGEESQTQAKPWEKGCVDLRTPHLLQGQLLKSQHCSQERPWASVWRGGRWLVPGSLP